MNGKEKKVGVEDLVGYLKGIDSKLATIGFPSILGIKTATFRARLMRGGRITIPDTEREALKIKEGDLLRVVVTKEEIPT